MVYNSMGSAGHGKHQITYRSEPNLIMKSINFFLLDRANYDSQKLLDCIWKHAGFLCERVDLDHTYHSPEGNLAHTYNLYFKHGRFGDLVVDHKYLNKIIHAIEVELPEIFPCDLRGRDHSNGAGVR